MAVGEVDCLAGDGLGWGGGYPRQAGGYMGGEFVDAGHDAGDAVVHVSKVQHFVAAEDRDLLAAPNLSHEQRNYTLHAFEVIVVAAVNVAEAEDQRLEAVALRIAGEEGFAGDFAGGVGGFGDDEVGHGFVGEVACDVAVDFAGGAENHRGFRLPRQLQRAERHRDILQGFLGLLYQLMHLRPGGEVDDDVGVEGGGFFEEFAGGWVGEVGDEGGEGRGDFRFSPPRIFDFRLGGGRRRDKGGTPMPRVGAFVDAQHVVAAGLEGEGEVGADLSGGAGDEDVHVFSVNIKHET